MTMVGIWLRGEGRENGAARAGKLVPVVAENDSAKVVQRVLDEEKGHVATRIRTP